MIKKVQQDLRAFFFTQDKYISHDKHLPFLKDPGDDIIIVMLYQHCHQQWTHVKGKNNHTIICQIYLLVLSTQCQNTISAELLSYLTVIFLLLKPNISALLFAVKSHNKTPRNFSGVKTLECLVSFVIVGRAGNSTDVTLLGIIQPCDTSYNMNYE